MKLGIPERLASQAARHVALGMPSKPTRQNDDDFLLVRRGFVISYNGSRNVLNWASWQLGAGDVGTLERKNDPFRHDPTLPKLRFRTMESADFRLPGYSRGHMVRSRERSASPRENRKTFTFPNVVAQSINNNTGPWNDLENYYLAKHRDEGMTVQVIAGGSDYEHPPIQARGSAVPNATWKVIVLLPKGKTVDDVDEHTRVIAVSMPNDNDRIKVEHDWARYRVSVAELERQGAAPLPFFDHLPAHVQQALKNRVDDEVIPPPPPREFVAYNYGEKPPSETFKIVESKLSGRVKFYSPDKKFGFIRLDDGREIFVHASGRSTSIAAGEPVTLDLATDGNGKLRAVGVSSLSPSAVPK